MQLINQQLLYSNHIIIDFKEKNYLIVWKNLEIINNILHLEGEDKFWMPRENYYYYCQLENKTFFPSYFDHSEYDYLTLYGKYIKGRVVVFDINLENVEESIILKFCISYLNNNFEIFTSLSNLIHLPSIRFSYYVSGKYIIKNNVTNLIIYSYEPNLEKSFEISYCNVLKRQKKEYLINIRKFNIIYRQKNKIFSTNKIWLINDRQEQAGDNGEYFFRYLNKLKPKGINFYYVIAKNCSDYKRFKLFDNIIDVYSNDYLNKFLISDKIISSISDIWAYNPFGIDGKYICDLFKFQFIYLQHGIIKDDIDMIKTALF